MDSDAYRLPVVPASFVNTSGPTIIASGPRNASWDSAPAASGRPLGGATQWAVLLLVAIVIMGLLGNLLVCIAITMEKKLQTVTNAFLMSLAVADLLVSIVVMPCSMVHQLMGRLVWCCLVLSGAVCCCLVLFGIVWCSLALFDTVWKCSALFCFVLLLLLLSCLMLLCVV